LFAPHTPGRAADSAQAAGATDSFSVDGSYPLLSYVEPIAAAAPAVALEQRGAAPSLPFVAAGENAGNLSGVDTLQLRRAPWFQAGTAFSAPGASSAPQIQGRPAQPAPATAANVAFPGSSALEAGLWQLVAEIGPAGRHADARAAPEAALQQLLAQSVPLVGELAPLPCPDLSRLETGLLQFLAKLRRAPRNVAGGRAGPAFWVWALAALAAAVACEIARREQRRAAGARACDVPRLPGSFPDDVLD
jgi:hypothetical protein